MAEGQESVEFIDPDLIGNQKRVNLIFNVQVCNYRAMNLSFTPKQNLQDYVRTVEMLRLQLHIKVQFTPEVLAEEKRIIDEVKKEYEEIYKTLKTSTPQEHQKILNGLRDERLIKQTDRFYQFYLKLLLESGLDGEGEYVNEEL